MFYIYVTGSITFLEKRVPISEKSGQNGISTHCMGSTNRNFDDDSELSQGLDRECLLFRF